MKRILSPLNRISLGLVVLTICLLQLGDLIGFFPKTQSIALEQRRLFSENLALKINAEHARDAYSSLVGNIRRSALQYPDLLSAAVYDNNQGVIAEWGSHSEKWSLLNGAESTPTQIRIQLYTSRGTNWGRLEMGFEVLGGKYWVQRHPIISTSIFMALVGFFVYFIYLRFTLRELNPDDVIPDRVRMALDTLSEGLLIVDKNDYIVFSNDSFSERYGIKATKLLGKTSSNLAWQWGETVKSREVPWARCYSLGESISGEVVKLTTRSQELITYSVNASPVMGPSGDIRGALLTFNDITEIEANNRELQLALRKLKSNQREIQRQNQELQVLATRDPLTGVLNRRSLFQGFDSLLAQAQSDLEQLSCIMVDIDHFKKVNDNHGHAVGDVVIKLMTEILLEYSRPNDLVGRLGGEEFILVLPRATLAESMVIGERIRKAVEVSHEYREANSVAITASFGVSSLAEKSDDGLIVTPAILVEKADVALYAAKNNGRNQVLAWSSELQAESRSSVMLPAEPSLEEGKEPPLLVPIALYDEGEHFPGDPINRKDDVFADVEPSIEASIILRANEGINDNGHTLASTTIPSPENPSVMMAGLTDASVRHPIDTVLLFDRIEQAITRSNRNETKDAVLVVNFEAIQRIYDTMGVSLAERFSQIILSRLNRSLRESDTVTVTDQKIASYSISRLSTNDVVILLPGFSSPESIIATIHRMFSDLSKPIELDGDDFFLNANVGISVNPMDGATAEVLIRNASRAMAEAKKSLRRNSFLFYSEEINSRSKRQIRLEVDIRRAIERNELQVVYQPKVDLRNGNIVGVEALMRWMHPQLGDVRPDEFIALAEQLGLIENFSRWLLLAIAKQYHNWERMDFDKIKIAFNLSAAEFKNPELGKNILELLKSCDLPAHALELEVTETVMIENSRLAVESLELLRAAGMDITLDDFGVAYSSFGYVRNFPLSRIKIDRSFIADIARNENDAAIVSAIISMGHTMGLKVVGEGIETPQQLSFLQELDCDEAQGFMLGIPMPASELNVLLMDSTELRSTVMQDVDAAQSSRMHGSGIGLQGVLSEFIGRGKVGSTKMRDNHPL